MTAYLKYYFSAITKYQVHPPYVYEFVEDIFEDDRSYYAFGTIENYRQNLLNTKESIPQNGDQPSMMVNQLAKNTELTPFYGQVLFKTVHHYKPDAILNLGTSLGISTLYQATPDPNIPVFTLEPSIPIAEKTAEYFKKLGTRNIEILSGDISTTLLPTLKELKTVNHVFFNSFWGSTSTLSYFEECLKFTSEKSIFIINKPYQSKESAEFWETIKKHKKVKLSIDLYNLGFLFFRLEQKESAHYQVIKSWKKPWAFM